MCGILFLAFALVGSVQSFFIKSSNREGCSLAPWHTGQLATLCPLAQAAVTRAGHTLAPGDGDVGRSLGGQCWEGHEGQMKYWQTNDGSFVS